MRAPRRAVAPPSLAHSMSRQVDVSARAAGRAARNALRRSHNGSRPTAASPAAPSLDHPPSLISPVDWPPPPPVHIRADLRPDLVESERGVSGAAHAARRAQTKDPRAPDGSRHGGRAKVSHFRGYGGGSGGAENLVQLCNAASAPRRRATPARPDAQLVETQPPGERRQRGETLRWTRTLVVVAAAATAALDAARQRRRQPSRAAPRPRKNDAR